MQSGRVHWSNRLAFIMAAAGSAVGLGNMWKFPYITGTNGGGAFVLIYLVCIAAVGVPIFIAELYIGAKSQSNAVQAFEKIHHQKSRWKAIGWLGLVSAFLILSFYSVVGGWILDFEYQSITGAFLHETDDQIAESLSVLFASQGRQLFWHGIFMALTVGIVMGGVKAGLERWNKILMPGLIVLLIGLLFYSFSLDGFQQSLQFMFSFDTSNLSGAGVLEAVGHAFFTLSLGMGAIITYGSYLKSTQKLGRTAVTVAFLDTAIALVCGIIIFSIVFSFGFEPSQGPSLMFKTLPMLFVKLPGAYFLSILFFLLVSFAALTSAVSLLEVVVAYWDEKHGTPRWKTTLLSGAVIYILGILSILSTNDWAEVKIFGLTFFDLFDKLTSQYFLPLGGLFISLFFGWVLGEKAVKEVFGDVSPFILKTFLWTSRVIAPAAVAVVMINKILQDFSG